MRMSALILSGVAVLVVLGAVAFRLLVGASQLAGLAAHGRLPMLPKSWRRFLLDEHYHKPN
jgi:hypothetical protein